MVHAVHVRDGRVSYRNRWVRTDRYEAQRKAGRRLVPISFSEPPPSEAIDPNKANTNVIWHAGRLLALDETALPMEMDPETLDTLGVWPIDSDYRGPMTAHPKFDPETGDMLAFAHQVDGLGSKTVTFTVVDAQGVMTSHERFETPISSLIHDFATTDEHVVFPVFPLTANLERAFEGKPPLAWEPQAGTHIGIMSRRDGVGSMQWFTGDPCHAYHPMNAQTIRRNGNTIVLLDIMKFPAAPLFPGLNGEPERPWLAEGGAELVRWTFVLDGPTRTFTEERLTEIEGEFPRVDDRFNGLSYRHGYYTGVTAAPTDGSGFDSIVHIDMTTGSEERYTPGPGRYFAEPVFVPRADQAPEGDGWLVTTMYDESRNLSDFVVLDAQSVQSGPVATVELPTRVPYGFHGNWRPGVV
jgi:carotenoid cleavage dioxygenase